MTMITMYLDNDSPRILTSEIKKKCWYHNSILIEKTECRRGGFQIKTVISCLFVMIYTLSFQPQRLY